MSGYENSSASVARFESSALASVQKTSVTHLWLYGLFFYPTFAYQKKIFCFCTSATQRNSYVYTLVLFVILKHVKTCDFPDESNATSTLICLICTQQASPSSGAAQATAAPINLTMMFQNLLFLASFSAEVLRAWQVFAALLSSRKYLYSMYLKAAFSCKNQIGKELC